MPWCHTCSIEYPVDLDECPECGHELVDAPALERRIFAGASAGLVTVAILPAEQAFVASVRLDRDGIPSALRDNAEGGSIDPNVVHVLVPPTQLAEARRVLRGKRRRTGSLMTYLLLVSAIAVFLSGAMVVLRWVLTGSPLPR